MPKLLISSNFSTSNLAFITIDLLVIKYFDDSFKVCNDVEEFEVEAPDIFLENISPL